MIRIGAFSLRMPLTLTITLSESGQVSVNGPLDQLMLCYGMLELAKDVIKAHQASKAVAVPSNGDVVAFGRRP